MSTTAATTSGGRGRPARPVLLAGVTTGTAMLAAAYWAGWRPAIPALPPFLASLAGAATAWLVFTAVASAAAGLLARHHRTLARHAARGIGRASIVVARAAGKGSRSVSGWLAGKAGPRWQARQHRPLMWHRQRSAAPTMTPPAHPGGPASAATEGNHMARSEAELAESFNRLDVLAAAERAFLRGDQARYAELRKRAWSMKQAEREDSARAPSPPSVPPAPAAGEDTSPAPPQAARQHQRPAGRQNAPAQWQALVAATADFEPEDDGQLLEWMAAEVAGMSAYAEALAEVYETCVNSLGVDPAAMNAVHDTADAAADAATAMAYARQKFAAHYAEVREFAASGGLLPFDGRWITGDGDT